VFFIANLRKEASEEEDSKEATEEAFEESL